ncbi:MAG: hypothetical protein ACR2M1_12635 [Gemmatimonadaceae bacterium]
MTRRFRLWSRTRDDPPDRIATDGEAGAARRERRGSALILTLVLTLGLASLATSAIYLGSNARLVTDSYDRERDLRYTAEAVLAMGKSTLNTDPLAIPDTGSYRTVFQNSKVNGADGLPVPGVTATMYLGRTSSNTGQYGSFVSVVAVAKNASGAQVVRRLELAQESFAKFAYWSNQESNSGSVIYFNNGDQYWGPVWSNDVLHIGSNGGGWFHDDVGTAATVSGAGYGTFDKGYSENQKPIKLPLPANLAYLSNFATAGGFNVPAAAASGVAQVMTRIEFVAKPVDSPNDSSQIDGTNDGFFRVYTSTAGSDWLRGDLTWDNCGASYTFKTGTNPLFVPMSEHRREWFARALVAAGFSSTDVKTLTNGFTGTEGTKGPTPPAVYSDAAWQKIIMQQASARCCLGGDPHLRTANIRGTSEYVADTLSAIGKNGTPTAAAMALAGNDTTFTASGPMGSWRAWPAGADASLTARWPAEAPYLFPISRTFNPGSKGVIYVNGTVGVSGLLRGRITLYASGSIAVLDDVRYATDPALNKCKDVLGVISGYDIMLADNTLNDPPDISSGSNVFRNMDDTPDTYLHGVLMALNTAFGAENFAQGAFNASPCEGSSSARGCLYITGGIIQQQRGATGATVNGARYGYVKRVSYDRCALYNPPPYFPTTGRYTDNRYYELDPSGFDVKKLFTTLQPK